MKASLSRKLSMGSPKTATRFLKKFVKFDRKLREATISNLENEPLDNESESVSNSENEANKPKNRLKPLLGIGAAVVVGGLAIGFALTVFTAPTALESSVENCFLKESSFAALDEDGKGLYLDGEGDESSGLPIALMACVLGELEVPDSVISRIDNTSSNMGQQTATWDGITALWSYHPNSGFDINFNLD